MVLLNLIYLIVHHLFNYLKSILKCLKAGGDIAVETKGKAKLILFFTYRGMLDNFSGFVYNLNDNKPSKSDFNGDFKQIKKRIKTGILCIFLLVKNRGFKL